MRKYIAMILASFCLLSLTSCGQKEDLKQGDYAMTFFFSGKVAEVYDDCLLLEVFDTGNTILPEGAAVKVSTEVESEDGCPQFLPGEYARVILPKNTDGNSTDPLTALSIYKTDETGRSIAD